MSIIKITAEDIRDPLESRSTVIRHEHADDCYGEICGQYYEDNGRALKPEAHSHMVITGHDPETTPRRYPISK